jgi:maleate isomerase
MGGIRIGMLTPSSNTVLEPVCTAMLADVADVSVHFSRFRVTEITLGDSALGQFDMEPMLRAADLLADARVRVICWNGTSGGWLGLDRDRRLCSEIERRTGIPATSSVLALIRIFELTGVRRFGLASPYVDAVQERIRGVFAAEGFTCAAERHLGISENFAYSQVDADQLGGMVRDIAAVGPDAITIFCTNLWGAPLADRMERETGIPVYDTIATGVWHSLCVAGVDPGAVRGWGRLFQQIAP